MADAEVLDRLDTIVALLYLAFSDEIGKARDALMRDSVAAALLDAVANGPVPAGSLKKIASDATKQSERTVLRRIAALVSQRVLEQIGSGPRTAYRGTGVFATLQRRPGAIATPEQAGDE